MPEERIRLKRHFHELSPEETDEVVNAVADLVVNYLVGSGEWRVKSAECEEVLTMPSLTTQDS